MHDDPNLNRATHIAEKIFSMDYFSAQLRLLYTAPLRDGQFDEALIKILYDHLAEIINIATHLQQEVPLLTPTVTIEAPATAPEKETQP